MLEDLLLVGAEGVSVVAVVLAVRSEELWCYQEELWC